MMWLYSIGIYIYGFTIRLFALLGNKKAALRIHGLEHQLIKHPNPTSRKTAWFHCASLGEFEQARPIIEAFKEHSPEITIIVSFFSPSGYEYQKDYPLADAVWYLPNDTPYNAKKFISAVQPTMVFFIKYEFWYNYMHVLKNNRIPTYLVSGIFREQQYFFKWYGKWFLTQLQAFNHFFLQNLSSLQLMERYFPGKSTLTGDTRFDRVYAISQKSKDFPLIKKFKGNLPLILFGSSWPADEDIYLPAIIQIIQERELKVIIAPHDIHPSRIEKLTQQLATFGSIKYSQIVEKKVMPEDIEKSPFLIIDNIGILSQLYQYAHIAYIGGGFGAGIHNILEAATFGTPILFGPKHQKFQEAIDLLHVNAAISISTTQQFDQQIRALLENSDLHKKMQKNALNYVHSGKGATQKIYAHVLGR